MVHKLLGALLPEWAHPDHPILQYELARLRQRGSLWTHILQMISLALLLGGAGYLYASSIRQPSPPGNLTEFVWHSLYFPTLLLQAISALIALAIGVGAVDKERHRNTWDHLRLTEYGAGLTLRTRWIAIVYRLRAPILAILLTRLLLLLGILYELTALASLYVQNIGASATPHPADWRITLLIIALLMAINLLLPLVMISASAALGLLISVVVKERFYALLLQALLSALFVALILGSMLAVTQVLQGKVKLTDGLSFTLVLAHTGFVDWGLLFTHLGSLAKVWKQVPYGVFIGFGLLLILLLQALAADGMLSLAARLAETRE